jgi:hypothetical protein
MDIRDMEEWGKLNMEFLSQSKLKIGIKEFLRQSKFQEEHIIFHKFIKEVSIEVEDTIDATKEKNEEERGDVGLLRGGG